MSRISPTQLKIQHAELQADLLEAEKTNAAAEADRLAKEMLGETTDAPAPAPDAAQLLADSPAITEYMNALASQTHISEEDLRAELGSRFNVAAAEMDSLVDKLVEQNPTVNVAPSLDTAVHESPEQRLTATDRDPAVLAGNDGAFASAATAATPKPEENEPAPEMVAKADPSIQLTGATI